MHIHAKTGKKQGNKICRINFSLPPVPTAMIPYDGAHNDLQQLDSIDANMILLKRKLDYFDANLNSTRRKLEFTKTQTLIPQSTN